MQYRVQQKATIWVETTVEAESLAEAIEQADIDFNEGNFREDPTSFELAEEYWAEDENGQEFNSESLADLLSHPIK